MARYVVRISSSSDPMTTLIHHSDPLLAPLMGGSSNDPGDCGQFVPLGFGSDTNSELLGTVRNIVSRQPTLRDSLDLIYREYSDLMQRLAD